MQSPYIQTRWGRRLSTDGAIAAQFARLAGDALLSARASSVDRGLDESALKAEGDQVGQRTLAEALGRSCPQDPVLSEEAADEPARLSSARVWIIDPLDGTREFAEGRDDWAVHVALWEGGVLAAGAVALPARGKVLSADSIAPVPARAPGPMRIAVSRSRPPEFVGRLADEMEAILVPMGSAGVKICAVIDGTVDAYVHGGGQYEWDSAAPVAVARAAGAHASRLDSSELLYNQPNPYLPDLLVCRMEFRDVLLGTISAVLNVEGNQA